MPPLFFAEAMPRLSFIAILSRPFVILSEV